MFRRDAEQVAQMFAQIAIIPVAVAIIELAQFALGARTWHGRFADQLFRRRPHFRVVIALVVPVVIPLMGRTTPLHFQLCVLQRRAEFADVSTLIF